MTELRLHLAAARATLRAAKDRHELARAEAEQAAIDGGCGGKNAEERTRNLTLVLAKDEAYQHALARLRAAEAEVDRLDALLEGARDARRAEEWQIRARLADALLDVPAEPDSNEHDTVMGRLGDLTMDEVLTRQRPTQPAYASSADDVELPF